MRDMLHCDPGHIQAHRHIQNELFTYDIYPSPVVRRYLGVLFKNRSSSHEPPNWFHDLFMGCPSQPLSWARGGRSLPESCGPVVEGSSEGGSVSAITGVELQVLLIMISGRWWERENSVNTYYL